MDDSDVRVEVHPDDAERRPARCKHSLTTPRQDGSLECHYCRLPMHAGPAPQPPQAGDRVFWKHVERFPAFRLDAGTGVVRSVEDEFVHVLPDSTGHRRIVYSAWGESQGLDGADACTVTFDRETYAEIALEPRKGLPASASSG